MYYCILKDVSRQYVFQKSQHFRLKVEQDLISIDNVTHFLITVTYFENFCVFKNLSTYFHLKVERNLDAHYETWISLRLNVLESYN